MGTIGFRLCGRSGFKKAGSIDRAEGQRALETASASMRLSGKVTIDTAAQHCVLTSIHIAKVADTTAKGAGDFAQQKPAIPRRLQFIKKPNDNQTIRDQDLRGVCP